jgi:hypothetical protein
MVIVPMVAMMEEAAQALSVTVFPRARAANFFASPSGLENAARGF